MAFDPVSRTREGLAEVIRSKVAGDDHTAEAEKIWDTPGERWFSEESAIWRVHADTAMFVGGMRALLLQSLHPLAMQAVSDHSGYRSDPWGRLQRTSHFLATTTYGSIEQAEQSIAVVRAVHERVTGKMPDGTPYRADDPHLLLWVHIAEVDSFLTTHQLYGQTPLDEADADRYVADTALIAGKLGVIDPPTTVAQVQALLADYRPELAAGDPAREAADLLLKHPPIPVAARVGYTMLAAGGVAALPAWARAELGLPTLPVADRLLAMPLAKTALGAIRWALSGPVMGDPAEDDQARDVTTDDAQDVADRTGSSR